MLAISAGYGMPAIRDQEGISSGAHIETHVPKHVSLVATPQFWLYIFCGLIASLVVATQFGLVPKAGSKTAIHLDLNGRPAPGAPVERPQQWRPPDTAPIDTSASSDMTTRPAPARIFEPPLTPPGRSTPKPQMPNAQPPAPVTEKAAPLEQVQSPVDQTGDVKPPDSPSTPVTQPDAPPATPPDQK